MRRPRPTLASALSRETEIGGNLANVGVVGGDNVNVAVGEEAEATTEIGVIEKSTIGGDAVNIGVVGGNNINAAIGKEAAATTSIGTIKDVDIGGDAR